MAAIGGRRHDRYQGAATLGDLRALSRYRRCEPDGEVSSPRGAAGAYLAKQLRDFRLAHRQNDDNVMMDNAALRVPQIHVVARYFSEQEAPGPIEDIEATDRAAGGALFNAGRPGENLPACAACHVKGDPAANSRHHCAAPDYIEKQLRDFKEGRRQNDPDGVMQRRRKLSARILPPLPRMPAASTSKTEPAMNDEYAGLIQTPETQTSASI